MICKNSDVKTNDGLQPNNGGGKPLKMKRSKEILVISLLCFVLIVVGLLTIMPSYRRAKENALLEYKEYAEEKNKENSVNKYAEMIETANIGEKIEFGEYEQDGNLENGKEKIEWIVLDKNEEGILVVSKYVLDCLQYNEKEKVVTTWETCSLRKWLNDTFLNETFSEEERKIIKNAYVPAGDNPYRDVKGGNATNDKVFLLSVSEAYTYFDTDEKRQCKPTAYAVSKGVKIVEDKLDTTWWTRSPGWNTYYNGTINNGGTAGIDATSWYVIFYDCDISEKHGVRPAMWLVIEN